MRIPLVKFIIELFLIVVISAWFGYQRGTFKGKHDADRWYAAHPVERAVKIWMPSNISCKNYSVTENQDGTYTIMWNQLGNE